MAEQDFYTLDQVSQILQLSRDTVRKFIVSKELPSYRVGKQIRISREDFNKFMEDLKQK